MQWLQETIFVPGWYYDWLRYGLIALGAYLIGGLNFAIIVSRLRGTDIRTQGSGNAGATNAFRVMGKRWGAVVGLGDIAKAAAAVLLGGLAADALGLDGDTGRMAAGMAAVAGHCFPLYFGFQGGKGVLTTAIVMLFVDLPMALIALGIFAVLVLLFRYISLGSMLAALSLPVSAFLLPDRSAGFRLLTGVIALGLVLMHRKNIARLLRGQESKVGKKKPPSPEAGTPDP
ncbi:MAG: glycerol-3-phosphate 1-O-acyltransferase PlsY [Oscillospiraceae bacterium]|nr:glycerol-3-phosphate 1-O-acyltransferase PlsY [Oscillospiraceae bacterium]